MGIAAPPMTRERAWTGLSPSTASTTIIAGRSRSSTAASSSASDSSSAALHSRIIVYASRSVRRPKIAPGRAPASRKRSAVLPRRAEPSVSTWTVGLIREIQPCSRSSCPGWATSSWAIELRSQYTASRQRRRDRRVERALLQAHLRYIFFQLHTLDRRHGRAELAPQRGGGAEEARIAADAAEGFEEAGGAPAVAELPVKAQAFLQHAGRVGLAAGAEDQRLEVQRPGHAFLERRGARPRQALVEAFVRVVEIAGVEQRRREVQQRPGHAFDIAALAEEPQRALAQLERAGEVAVQPRREGRVVQRAAGVGAILELLPQRAREVIEVDGVVVLAALAGDAAAELQRLREAHRVAVAAGEVERRLQPRRGLAIVALQKRQRAGAGHRLRSNRHLLAAGNRQHL